MPVDQRCPKCGEEGLMYYTARVEMTSMGTQINEEHACCVYCLWDSLPVAPRPPARTIRGGQHEELVKVDEKYL
jgi:hypothetical protein